MPITQVTSRSVSRDLVLTGTLVGNRESDVASDAVGKVTATFAERGELVKKGAPIARLDASNAALEQRRGKSPGRGGARRTGKREARMRPRGEALRRKE